MTDFPLVEHYLDYRKFLIDFSEIAKKSIRNFNLARWAKDLGLSNVSTLTKILKGQRDPGEAMIDRFIEYFEDKPSICCTVMKWIQPKPGSKILSKYLLYMV